MNSSEGSDPILVAEYARGNEMQRTLKAFAMHEMADTAYEPGCFKIPWKDSREATSLCIEKNQKNHKFG
jgi:hypothetical protein